MTDMTEEELAIARGDVVADAKQEDTKAAAADNVDADEAARKAA